MKILSNAQLAELLDKDIFHQIGEAADALGVPCYVVGGYVRDLFLERPSNDIDVVVVGSGIQVADALRKKLGKKAHISVFRNFGTAQLSLWVHEKKVIATTRVSLSWKMAHWKTTKTDATLPSTPWQFALMPKTLDNWSTPSMGYTTLKMVLYAHRSTPILLSLTTRCAC